MVAFDRTLRGRICDNLAAHGRLEVPGGERRHAAVVVALADDGRGQASFLLTRRAATLRSHTGQWALPGGRLDQGESVVDAGRRELGEEVGIVAAEVLGLLDDYPTRSGYRITPLVAWLPPGTTVTPDPQEVAEVHLVPLADLDGAAPPRFLELPDAEGPIIQLPLLGTLIHAPTGAILHQFREVALHGRPVRVAHYDEPPFARR